MLAVLNQLQKRVKLLIFEVGGHGEDGKRIIVAVEKRLNKIK